jgi:pimeloyl-ACP methyl ester carboxylesterase
MQLHTKTIGTGSRSAALVHGLTSWTETWRSFAPILVEEYDCTVTQVDQRGHGESARGDRYRVTDFVGDLVDTLPTGLDLLIGQSLGGRTTALAAAELAPKRWIGLDPALFGNARLLKPLRHLVPLFHRAPEGLLRRIGAVPKGSHAEAMADVRMGWSKWDGSMLNELLQSVIDEPYAIGPPAVPSTLLLAHKSPWVPADRAAEMRAQGWDVRVKPNAVHDLHLQDPLGVAALLDDVLRSGTSSPASAQIAEID